MYGECPKCHGKDDHCPLCKGQGLVNENGDPPSVVEEGQDSIKKVHEDELNR